MKTCRFICICMLSATIFPSCKSTENTTDTHYHQELTERLDSLIRSTTLFQQSFREQQTSLIDSFRQRESYVTNHTITLSAKGDTIKEETVIREYVESDHSSEMNMQTKTQDIFIRFDSLIAVNRELQQRVDSVLQKKEKTTVVKAISVWDRLCNLLSGIGLAALCLGVYLMIQRIKKA